jgi:general secretion pathway protein M
VNLPDGIRGRVVAIGLLLLPLILLFHFVGRPLQSAYAGLNDDIDGLRSDVARYRGLIAGLPELRAMADRLERMQPLAPYLLAGDNPTLGAAALQRHLRTIAERAGASVTSVRVEPADGDDDLAMVRLRARLQTDSAGLRTTLHALETQRPFVFVEQIRISTRQRDPRQGDGLDVQLTLSGLLDARASNDDPGADRG